jgi:hypothetical protein
MPIRPLLKLSVHARLSMLLTFCRQQRSVLVAAFAIVTSCYSPVTAQYPDDTASSNVVSEDEDIGFGVLVDAYVASIEKQSTLRATGNFLQAEISRLEAATGLSTEGTLVRRLATLPAETQDSAFALQKQNYAPYLDSLKNSRNAIRKDVDAARLNLRNARSELSDSRVKSLETTSRSNIASQVAVLFNPETMWLWLCGLMAGLTLIIVYGVAHRHYLRRLSFVWKQRFRRRVALLALLALIPFVPLATILLTGDDAYEALLSAGEPPAQVVRTEITEEIETLENEITREGLQEQVDRDHQQHEIALKEWQSSLPQELSDAGTNLVSAWTESRQTMLAITVDLALLSEFSTRFETDVAEVGKLDAEISGLSSQMASNENLRRWNSGYLGSCLLLVYGVVGLVFVARDRSRNRTTRNTCPRCRAVGKLERSETGGSKGAEFRCTNVIRDDPDPYEECGFVFNESYLARNKIMFPTLGVTSSGKTHWMVMVYRDLSRGRFPEKVHFSKIKGAAATEMDQLVDGILNHRLNVPGTQTDSLPHPLIFDFTDNDRLQKSHILTNVSDYGGEVFEKDNHTFRDQLLDAQGYFVFLDPTKSDETQVKALGDFRQDLQLFRKVPPGKIIHSPVALCISKLDLMVNQRYAQNSDIIQTFYKELSAIDENTQSLTLDRIQQRSDLVARLCGVIWPGWPLQRQIRDLFGERFMLFPLTPVGLDRPGEEDLTKRNIEPYGTVEPLLWLLHMNGYPVL